MTRSVKAGFCILFLLNSMIGFSRTTKETSSEKQKTIYFFSGIGADSSAFSNLRLPGYHKVYINWIPALPHESLTHYAGRIRSQITENDPYIVGLSFGGIVAVEVSKQMKVGKMVLISSARTMDNLNQFQCFFLRLGFYRLVPGSLLKHTNALTYKYFGAHSPADKTALEQLLCNTDISFFRWALKNVGCWDNIEKPDNTIEIHGTADRIITHRLATPDYSIKGGGHLMVFNKADTVSKIIMNYFQ